MTMTTTPLPSRHIDAMLREIDLALEVPEFPLDEYDTVRRCEHLCTVGKDSNR